MPVGVSGRFWELWNLEMTEDCGCKADTRCDFDLCLELFIKQPAMGHLIHVPETVCALGL